MLYKGSRDMYLEAKDEMISNDLKELGNNIENSMHLDWLMDYISEHGSVDGDLSVEEDNELCDVFPDQYSGEFNDQHFRQHCSDRSEVLSFTVRSQRESTVCSLIISTVCSRAPITKNCTA